MHPVVEDSQPQDWIETEDIEIRKITLTDTKAPLHAQCKSFCIENGSLGTQAFQEHACVVYSVK